MPGLLAPPPQSSYFQKSPVQVGLKEFSIACGVGYNAIFRSCPYNFCPWLYADAKKKKEKWRAKDRKK